MRVTFGFHSVRPTLAIPSANMWQSQELHQEMVENLHVDPDWFSDWLDCLKAHPLWAEEDECIITFDDAFRDVLVPAILAVKKGFRTIVFVPTAHIGMVFPYAPYDVMDGMELAFLSSQGVELGSHGHFHRDMTKMGLQSLEGSLRLSKEVLEAVSKSRVVSFAAPHGHLDHQVIEVAKSVGYHEVFGTNEYPAGKIGTHLRFMGNMEGYRDASGIECAWPWET